MDPNSNFDELVPVDDGFLQDYMTELSSMNVDTVRRLALRLHCLTKSPRRPRQIDHGAEDASELATPG